MRRQYNLIAAAADICLVRGDLLDRDGGLSNLESCNFTDDAVTNIEVEANQFVNVLSEI